MAFRSVFSICLIVCLIGNTLAAPSHVSLHEPQQQKTKECPPGFTLKGKSCEAVEVVEPRSVCPRGTTSTADGQCLTFAPPKVQCPPGFTLQSGGRDSICVRVGTAPVEYYCDEGVQEGKMCKSVIPKPPVCPAGYAMEGHSCAKFSHKLKKCPVGYHQQDNTCSKKVSFPASPVCPHGTELSDGQTKCFRFEERKPFCPSGYQMDTAGQCVRYVSKVRIPCPPGYKNVGSRCETTEEYPADVICPADMQLQGEVCLKAIPVSPKCPAGYVPSVAVPGTCDRFLPSRPICPPDTTPAGAGHCKRKIVTEKYPKCPQGFEMIAEKCKKIDEFPTRTVCRVGRQEGDQCVTQEIVAPQYACPDGFELTKTSKGPQCTQIVQYDCSTTTTKRECEMPEFVGQLTPGGNAHFGRKLKGDYAPQHMLAQVAPQHGKQPVCRQVPVTVPKTCTRQEVAAVKYVCNDGGVLVGKNCQLQQLTPADVICTAGDMDAETGRCLKIGIAMPSWHCTSGTDAGDRACVEFENLPADYVCPEGTEADFTLSHGRQLKCVDRKPEITFPDKIVKQPATVICAVGRLTGRKCVQPVHSPAEYECPHGSEHVTSGVQDSKCVVAAELITPQPVEIATPVKFVCPGGAPAPSKVCFTSEPIAIEEFCPAGMTLDYSGDRCVASAELIVPAPLVKVISARPACPEGFNLHGSVCRTTERVPVERFCPAGFEMVEDNSGKETCARDHELTAVCPPGTVASQDGCVRRKTAPPQVTIVRTCTKGMPGCH